MRRNRGLVAAVVVAGALLGLIVWWLSRTPSVPPAAPVLAAVETEPARDPSPEQAPVLVTTADSGAGDELEPEEDGGDEEQDYFFVSGRVVTADHRPAAGARVSLRSGTEEYIDDADAGYITGVEELVARTDREGRFTLRAIPGPAELSAAADAGTARMQLEVAGQVSGLELVLHSTSLRVVVRTPEHQPLPRMPVSALDQSSGVQRNSFEQVGALEGTTDEAGEAVFKDLVPGNVRVRVEYAISSYVIGTGLIVEGQQTVVEVEVRSHAALSGVVVDEVGTPLGGAHVALVGSRVEHGRDQTTGSDGTFDFTVAPGTFELVVTHTEGVARVQVKAPATGVRVVLGDRGVLLSGTVAEEGGKPLPFAVELYGGALDLFNDPVAKTVARADGTWALRRLPPGRYVLRAFPKTAGDGRGAVKDVTLPQSPDHLELAIVIPQSAPVRGIVVDDSGQPVADAQVTAYVARPGMQSVPYTRAGKDGRFEFPAMAEDAELVARLEGTGESLPTKVHPGQSDVRVVLRRAGKVTGRFIGPNGAPLTDYWLNFRHFTSPTGAFELALDFRLPSQPIPFRAAALGGCVYLFTSKPGETVDLGVLRAEAHERVRYLVVDEAGQPVAKQFVSYSAHTSEGTVGLPPQLTLGQPLDEISFSDATDAQGVVLLPPAVDARLFISVGFPTMSDVPVTVGATEQKLVAKHRR